MNWRSTSKVKAPKNKRPSVGIPRPAGYWVVDKSSPNKDEYKEWTQPTTFSNGAHSKGGPIKQVSTDKAKEGNNKTYVIAAN